MAISLQKGGNVNLSKEAPGLTRIIIGLGWDPRATDGAEFDLDGSAFLLKADGKVRGDSDFIFYNNLKSSDGSVRFQKEDRTVDVECGAVGGARIPAQADGHLGDAGSFLAQVDVAALLQTDCHDVFLLCN